MEIEFVGAACPKCGAAMNFLGSAGIVDPEDRWDAETERYRCVNGHMVFVADAARIDEAEKEAADE